MLTVPKSKVVRGFSFFGVSFVYVIFEDGTDPYWARSRVLEYLNAAARRLPAGVTPTLGPDATGVGWVYQYAVVAKELTLAELRSLQDWVVRFAASKAEGVAEVASVGGFVKQYNVVVDPAPAAGSGHLACRSSREAVRASNMDVGGRTVELSEFEFMVRGRGYLKSIADIENIVLKTDGGAPLRLARRRPGRDSARTSGAASPSSTARARSRAASSCSASAPTRSTSSTTSRRGSPRSQPSLPKGAEIVPVYDRSQADRRRHRDAEDAR